MTSSTGKEHQGNLELQQEKKGAGPVECLGLTFENDQARREHFIALLKEKLQDPGFRKIPGFPQGSDKAILRMSDPPYYTACPNPFLKDFVHCHGKPYDPNEVYEREPFAVDVSVGKTDQLYKAHGYHTKVPHLAIIPSILHYTKPGDIVLDGFCGSGMTGLAARLCETLNDSCLDQIGLAHGQEETEAAEWGRRFFLLNDLSPAASFISAGYTLPFDIEKFKADGGQILADLENELGWMYETLHTDGKSIGKINYTVWSEEFSCPECSTEIDFISEALDSDSNETKLSFACPACGSLLNKRKLERIITSEYDKMLGRAYSKTRRKPVKINYTVNGKTYEKQPDSGDLELIKKIEELDAPAAVPIFPMMHNQNNNEAWGDEWRSGVASFTHVHHAFLPRQLQALSLLWERVNEIPGVDRKRQAKWLVEQAIWGMSLMARYAPTHFSQVNQYMSGRIRILSQHAECSPFYILGRPKSKKGKLGRLLSIFGSHRHNGNSGMIQAGDCAHIDLPANSVDYIFTDPPFGANFAYSELNFIIESWHGVTTAQAREAIESDHQKKRTSDYQALMKACFCKYYEVLKPGRWITVIFSNNSNAVWRAIQEAIGVAGFVIADVKTLDKKQGTFNQVAGHTVKQDLIISAYKPSGKIENPFSLGEATAELAWLFVREHLSRLPKFIDRGKEIEIVVERTSQMLLDRMIAFHVQHGISVPLSGPEFLQGLVQRFPERDGMYFLPDQVTEYDRKRTTATQLRQLSFFVNDEHSAIQWIRQQLQDKPQSFQDLQPQFMRELQAWAKHEQTVELKVILEQNFLHYDGRGPVPSQIHSYLSTNFKDLRNLGKEDSKLIEKARDRWYVPDPNKQADLDQIRERALLKEFEDLKESSQRKIKQFRTEAIRAGFKACWQERDYATIVKVAAKLPEAVLQEDEKLLMYVDNAQTRLGDDG